MHTLTPLLSAQPSHGPTFLLVTQLAPVSKPIIDMVVDQDHHRNDVRKVEEEDKEMLPPQPALLSTPLKKPPTCEREALSSRKTSLQEIKPTGGEVKGGIASKVRLSNELSDLLSLLPPHPVSPLPHKLTMPNRRAVTPLYIHFQVSPSL